MLPLSSSKSCRPFIVSRLSVARTGQTICGLQKILVTARPRYLEPTRKNSLLNTPVDATVIDYTEAIFICHNDGQATLEFNCKQVNISG
jgi:hypothetical protein